MKTPLKNIILVFIISINFYSYGKNRNGSLIIRVKQGGYNVWSHVKIVSNNLKVNLNRFIYNSEVKFDSMLNGQYELILISELGDKIEKNIIIKNNTKLSFNLKNYYSKDTSTSNFIDNLTNNDTLKIFTIERGCFHLSILNCYVTKIDSNYFIYFMNTNYIDSIFKLSKQELDIIRNTEIIGRVKYSSKSKVYQSTITTLNYFSCNRQIISFNYSKKCEIMDLFNKYKIQN